MIGKQVSHYRILELISEGGMGAVYKARDLRLDRTVAIKVMKPVHRDPEEASRRFLREARAVSRIDHPNVVTLFEVFQESGVSHMVMQYVEGGSLRAKLAAGRLPAAQALAIARDVGAGLEAAHALGIVHRDLKPENVVLTQSGLSKVLDFGVAHLVDLSSLTDRGRIVGTVPYMSPEQIAGHQVDARSDVYSFGVLLYEMLTGRLPFQAAEEVVLFYEITNREPPSPAEICPDLPEGLDRVLLQALQKDPAQRYPSVSAMLHDLEIIRSRVVPSPVAPHSRLYARHRTTIVRSPWAGLVLLAALAVLGYVAVKRDFFGLREPSRVMIARWETPAGEEGTAWLSGGMMDGLSRKLVGRPGIRVVSRPTVVSALAAVSGAPGPHSEADLVRVAERLGARYLVTGDVETTVTGIRLTCELTDLSKGILVGSWSEEVRDLESQLFASVDRLADAVAASLGMAGGGAGGGTVREAGAGGAGGAGGRFQGALAGGASPGDGIARAPIEAERLYQEALTFSEVRDFAGALDRARRALEVDSTFTEAHLLIARISPEIPEVAKHLEAAMRHRHHAPPATRKLVEAKSLAAANRIDAAIAKYREVLEEDPEDVAARRAVAELSVVRRRFAEASAEFTVLHRLNPFDFYSYPWWWVAYVEIGRTDRALWILSEWRRQFPEGPAPLRELIQANRVLGNYRLALALCDTLDALSPGAATILRGPVLDELGRRHEAERAFEQLLRSPDPEYASSRGSSYLAYLAFRRGDYARGLTRMEAVLREQPDVYNQWLAGILAARGGNVGRANELAKRIEAGFVSAAGDTAAPEAYATRRLYHNLMGMIRLGERRPARAVAHFRESTRYVGRADGPYFRTWLGYALLEAGDPEGASRELARALALNPNYPEALLYRGRALLELRESREARRTLERLTTIWNEADMDDPLHVELKRLLAEAERRG